MGMACHKLNFELPFEEVRALAHEAMDKWLDALAPFFEKGFPIGSGGIKSANKFICHTRMKRPGAWWVKEIGNAMLRIRCAIYNGTFHRVFQRYIESQNT